MYVICLFRETISLFLMYIVYTSTHMALWMFEHIFEPTAPQCFRIAIRFCKPPKLLRLVGALSSSLQVFRSLELPRPFHQIPLFSAVVGLLSPS